jgi:hypothetical protein
MIMIPPSTITLKEVRHGSGLNGMALYVSRCEEYGIQREERRSSSRQPFVSTWTCDYLPDQEFRTLDELHKAIVKGPLSAKLKPLVTEVKAAETGRYSTTSKCWLCGTGKTVWEVRAKHGWRTADVWWLPSCEVCLTAVLADPAKAHQARLDACKKGK